MKSTEKFTDMFMERLNQATDCLRNLEFVEAYQLIVEAISINPNAPQPHNLLGIWFELKGNKDKARKHYRAAYALDPTFKPACKNLEQICTMFENSRINSYDFGDEPKKEARDVISLNKKLLNRQEQLGD